MCVRFLVALVVTTVHISGVGAHQWCRCTSVVSVHITAHQWCRCTSVVSTAHQWCPLHISGIGAHQWCQCTSVVSVHISGVSAHQWCCCTSVVSLHISGVSGIKTLFWQEVHTMWAGLGYYSRGERLWKGAKKVTFPHTPKREKDPLPPSCATSCNR